MTPYSRKNVNKFRFLADLLDEHKIPYEYTFQSSALHDYLTVLYYPSREDYIYKVTDVLQELSGSSGLIVSYKFIHESLNYQEELEPLSIFHKVYQDWEIKKLVKEITELKFAIAQLQITQVRPMSPYWHSNDKYMSGPYKHSDNSEKET